MPEQRTNKERMRTARTADGLAYPFNSLSGSTGLNGILRFQVLAF